MSDFIQGEWRVVDDDAEGSVNLGNLRSYVKAGTGGTYESSSSTATGLASGKGVSKTSTNGKQGPNSKQSGPIVIPRMELESVVKPWPANSLANTGKQLLLGRHIASRTTLKSKNVEVRFFIDKEFTSNSTTSSKHSESSSTTIPKVKQKKLVTWSLIFYPGRHTFSGYSNNKRPVDLGQGGFLQGFSEGLLTQWWDQIEKTFPQ